MKLGPSDEEKYLMWVNKLLQEKKGSELTPYYRYKVFLPMYHQYKNNWRELAAQTEKWFEPKVRTPKIKAVSERQLRKQWFAECERVWGQPVSKEDMKLLKEIIAEHKSGTLLPEPWEGINIWPRFEFRTESGEARIYLIHSRQDVGCYVVRDKIYNSEKVKVQFNELVDWLEDLKKSHTVPEVEDLVTYRDYMSLEQLAFVDNIVL